MIAFVKIRRDFYQAIADPAGREIINLVASQLYNVHTISGKLDMTSLLSAPHLGIAENQSITTFYS